MLRWIKFGLFAAVVVLASGKLAEAKHFLSYNLVGTGSGSIAGIDFEDEVIAFSGQVRLNQIDDVGQSILGNLVGPETATTIVIAGLSAETTLTPRWGANEGLSDTNEAFSFILDQPGPGAISLLASDQGDGFAIASAFGAFDPFAQTLGTINLALSTNLGSFVLENGLSSAYYLQTVVATPIPGALPLAATGFGALVWLRRRRRRT
jgi:hypothetical protein